MPPSAGKKEAKTMQKHHIGSKRVPTMPVRTKEKERNKSICDKRR